MSTNTPTEDDLDAAAAALIERLAVVLYIEEMGDAQRVRNKRSRQQIRSQARAVYGRWVDTDRIDRMMDW